jgi:hypothetical protein
VLMGISDWNFMIFLRHLWKIVAINESVWCGVRRSIRRAQWPGLRTGAGMGVPQTFPALLNIDLPHPHSGGGLEIAGLCPLDRP